MKWRSFGGLYFAFGVDWGVWESAAALDMTTERQFMRMGKERLKDVVEGDRLAGEAG